MTDKQIKPCTDARELAKKIQGIYHQGVYEDETSKIGALIQSAFDKIRREDIEKGWNYIRGLALSPTFGMNLTKHDFEAAIIGKEPGHDAE